MANNNITSTNSVSVMTVDDIFPAGFNLEQFATDTSITLDETVFSESRMGVDGKMVSGFIPSPKVVTFTFEASSPTVEFLNTLASAMEANKTIYLATLVVTIPSISKTYTFANGALTSGKVLPDIKKLLDPVSYKFTFESLKSSSI